MADTPFAAGEDPTQNLPTPETFGRIRDQWNTFLDQPGGRAALLQAGLALMQPPSFGDTGASQIGRAIGAGGEALGRQELMDIRAQEAASKQDLRGAQAQAAEARAGAAGTSALLQRERLQATQENIKLQQRVKLGIDYGRFKLAAEAENRKRQADYERNKIMDPTVLPPQMIPIPSPDEWIRQREQFTQGTGLQGGEAPAPTGAGPTTGIQDAPPNPADRIPNTSYNTPKGVLTWTGTGWIK